MTVFNTFWKIVKKYKGTIILYTVLLVVFGTINMTSSNVNTTFTNSKPSVLIVNEDENIGLTKNLINYIEKNSEIKKIANSESARDDAIFYRDVNYIIYIPKGYRKDILSGKNVNIDIKSSKDFNSSLADMILSRYLKVQSIYSENIKDEKELIDAINNNLSTKANVEITSKVDKSYFSNLANYFNFASYSIMAVTIYIICLVLSSFNEQTVSKRIITSSMNYKKHNRLILYSSFIYSFIVWILYVILGLILLKANIFDLRFLLYSLNTLLFTFTSLTLALLISTLIKNKGAITGIVNVVSLGSAFLCGAFVPVEFLPNTVLNVAHILPAYWYINSNNLLADLEVINLVNLENLFFNSLILILFSVLFIILNNIISGYKRRD